MPLPIVCKTSYWRRIITTVYYVIYSDSGDIYSLDFGTLVLVYSLLVLPDEDSTLQHLDFKITAIIKEKKILRVITHSLQLPSINAVEAEVNSS